MKLIVGVDYYLEDGKFVLTEDFLSRRGYCCQNGCRNCPYGPLKQQPGSRSSSYINKADDLPNET